MISRNWMVYIALVVVSLAYNQIVSYVNRETDGVHPLASLGVAIGVLYTIMGATIIDGTVINVMTLIWCFGASGTPMILGDVARWIFRLSENKSRDKFIQK